MPDKQSDDNATEPKPCYPDICKLLEDFGALTEKVNSVETRLQDSENQILELQHKERTKIIFSALLGGGYVGPFSTDRTLVYSRVITNLGNAYSPGTGVFTAPVAGVYYFTFFCHAGGNHPQRVNLYKNSLAIVMASDHSSKNDSADNAGNAVFLQLQQGDRVYVRMAAGSHLWGGESQTTFSGFLVTQM
ncbi:complement C1q-like protein 3 [Maylandia zebra]|uniref:complement C1q-like protein 3 n=1 Tax=Maylandia zebra TaxID=106582 RepID=UPI00403CE12A